MSLIPVTAASNEATILELAEAYPFLRTGVIGYSVLGTPIRSMTLGNGPRKVLFTAAHHANEWLTACILQTFARDLAQAIAADGQLAGIAAGRLAEETTIHMVPLVNPDGADLVNGALTLEETAQAQRLSENYPGIPFPSGWKANIRGVDLNLQYPAGWLRAREIKFMQGFTQPGPRDYVGRAPLNQFETQALAGYTEFLDPALVIALHSQGREIYWQFMDIRVPGAEELGRKMAEASGYALADTPYASGFAGYKDWFLQQFRRPGYTVEVGEGVNPLPISQFETIYRDVLPILVIGARGE